ncbi:IS3 family transposase [Marinomonas gallaica]|uniref:IS3 family transposase n=1 Tax=Marinomonas gallaica TaxID=1806667 RepID=UPI0008362C32
MSRKGNCWDIAHTGSFLSQLEVKLIYAEHFESITAAKSAIFEFIEVFYNRESRHSVWAVLDRWNMSAEAYN